MNKTLGLRTKPEFYVDLIKAYERMNLTKAEVDAIITENIREATELLAGKCPKCGAPSTRTVDQSRQQGEKGDMPGGWVQYRCSTQPPIGQLRALGVCDFMVDFVEGEAAS